MRSDHQILRPWWVALLVSLLCAGGPVATAKEPGGRTALGILGYNYTDRYIDSFSVDGQGGGNIQVTSPTSGGSGIVCCTLYRQGSLLKTVRVRWQAGACYFSEHSSLSKRMFDTLYPIFKEQDAPIEVLASSDAKYLEVHFYPDGSIKAAVTIGISSPRLSLSKQREDQTPYPRCPNDRKPAE